MIVGERGAVVTRERGFAFAGTTITVLVGGEETGGAFAVLHVIKPQNSSTPPHSHDTETELAYPLVGSVGVETEGRIQRFGPGEPIVLPPGRPHRLFNDSGMQAREFLLCAPAVFDRFVAAAGTAVPSKSEPGATTNEDRQRLVAMAPAFGIRLLRSATPDGDALQPPVQHAEAIDVLGMRVDVLARLGTGADNLVLLRAAIQPDRFVPLHSHADQVCLFVIDGEMDLYFADGGWKAIGSEEAVNIVSGRRHALRNIGSAPGYVLVVTTVRMLDVLIAIGSPATGPEPRPPRPEDLVSVSQYESKYGLWIASSDENVDIGLTG